MNIIDIADLAGTKKINNVINIFPDCFLVIHLKQKDYFEIFGARKFNEISDWDAEFRRVLSQQVHWSFLHANLNA